MSAEEEARTVAERLLRQTGAALMSGDFDSFVACFADGHVIDTFEGQCRLDGPEDIRRTFDQVRAYLHRQGVTDLVRRVVSAEFTAPDTIKSSHESRFLRGDHLVQDPFVTLSVIRDIGGRWRLTHSQYAITAPPAHNRALIGILAGRTADRTPDGAGP